MMLDVLRYVGAVTREVQNREHAGRPARAVVATCAYDTTIVAHALLRAAFTLV